MILWKLDEQHHSGGAQGKRCELACRLAPVWGPETRGK